MRVQKNRFGGTLFAVAMYVFSASVSAQESANAELDACVTDQQVRMAAKGALIGIAGGLGTNMFSNKKDKKDKALKAAVIGGVVGAAGGFATAYYTAFAKCTSKHPEWIVESNLVRDNNKSYKQVNQENRYNARDGIVVLLKKIDAPQSVQPGQRFPIDSTFDLMTPNGAETEVQFQRKLFVIADGQEAEMQFPLASTATRVVEAGRSHEVIHVPTPSDAPKGTMYRVEISALAGDKPAVVQSTTVTVI